MANIDSKISKIKTAERGEDVRDSIISALRDINNDVPADMSNPVQIRGTMPAGTDLTIPINPPKLVNQVYIQQAGSGGKNTVLIDAKISENGKYPSEDKDDGGGSYDPDKEIRYYKSVDVDVPQLANKVLDLEEEITQNGTYSAFDWGADGLRSFTVNVNSVPVGGQFEVEFYDKPITDATAKVIETQLVPAYGTAMCTLLDGSTYQSQYFKGWNPTPSNVTRNMKCYPVYGESSIDPGEIPDSWDVIVQDGGAHYPLGSYKSLIIDTIPTWSYESPGVDYDNVIHDKNGNIIEKIRLRGPGSASCAPVAMHMVKVAEGESGSHSTWISTGCLKFTTAPWNNQDEPMFAASRFGFNGILGTAGRGASVYQGWGGSNLETYLNNFFFSALPDALKNNIKQVTKHYMSFSLAPVDTGDGAPAVIQQVERTALNKIWALSLKELHTLIGELECTLGTVYEEFHGIDYSAVYQPYYGNTGEQQYSQGYVVALRSCGLYSEQLRGVGLSYTDSGGPQELRSTVATVSKSVPFGFCL